MIRICFRADGEPCDFRDEKGRDSCSGSGKEHREGKGACFAPEGERYSEKLLYSLSRMEERAAKRLGEDKIRRMTELFMEYDQILEEALEETDDEE